MKNMIHLATGGSAADGVSEARLIVGSVGSVPFAADTQILVGPLTGRAPLPDREASV
jgi:hypothetical protein